MKGSISKVARTLRFLCDLYLGCALVGTAGCVIWILLILFAPSVTQSRHTASSELLVGIGQSVPVTVGPEKSESVTSAGISNTVGTLTLNTNDGQVRALCYLYNLVFSVLILGLAYLSRQFLVDVIDGRPFTFENASRLQGIGWLLLIWGLANPLVHGFVANRVLPMVKIQSPVLIPPPGLDFPWILVSIFVLILSAAFRHGVELEQERSLTV